MLKKQEHETNWGTRKGCNAIVKATIDFGNL